MKPAPRSIAGSPRRGRARGCSRPALPGLLVGAALVLAGASAQGQEMPQALSATPGDPVRGRAILVDRRLGLCLLCHSGPFPDEPAQGNLATDLGAVGSRWSAAQLRARLVDPRRLNPDTIMPSYFSTEGLNQVEARWRGKTLLQAQQIEDLLAFLLTLRGGGSS